MKILPYNISTRGNEGCPGGSKTSGENEVEVTIRYLWYNQAVKKGKCLFNVLKYKKNVKAIFTPFQCLMCHDICSQKSSPSTHEIKSDIA